MCINSVGAQLAQKAKSVTICDELPGLEQQNGCRFAVVMSEAQEQNNPNLCDTLSDEYRNTCKNEAYRTQAIMSKDIILCDRLQEDSASGTVSWNKKDQCILSVLLLDESTRPESCERINDPSLREMCSESTKK